MLVAKKIKRIAKLEFFGGAAKPGPELAGLGLVMPNFTREFNDATRDRGSEPVPVTITVYEDKSHSFVLHTTPAAFKLKQAAKIKKGSANSKTQKVATISAEEVRKIAEYKLPDLNTDSVESAINSIVGTAKQMGILVEGLMDVKAEKAAAEAAAKAEAAAAKKDAELAAAEAAAKEAKNTPIEVETTAQSNPGDKEEATK